MDDSGRDEAAIIGLFLQRCLADRERGELCSLGEYQAGFPGFEDAIAREYAQLVEAPIEEEIGSQSSVFEGLSAHFGADLDPAIRLGEGETGEPEPLHGDAQRRYRVLGEIARGGFGSILKVWERDLRRTLAMKVLRERRSGTEDEGGSAFSHLLGRFLEEAQITGQLDHPGIVSVHELGLDSSGRVFFTMPLVRGRTLEGVIELVESEDEGWSRARAIGVLLRVCEAVAFAHSKGVVHRDLKPANIMVGRFGETRVMDWGLARVLGRKDNRDIRLWTEECAEECTEEDEGLSAVLSMRRELAGEEGDSPLVTMEGDVVGTPAYMPPEQAQGRVEEVGPQSDVYAIGAMLYHLLAGEIPYVEKGKRTSSRVVLSRVLAGPPRPLHELCPGLPAELVAICEKAMARRPADRYAGALELAEDLRAFLEVRVVRAYETGTFAELRKWVKRNKALSLASAAAVLALAIGLGFSMVESRRATENAAQASQQARRAEDNFQMAFEAVDEMLSEVGQKTLANVPQMDEVRRSLLEKALAFHQRFLEARRDDPGLRREVARSYVRIGKIHWDLGDIDKAEAAKQRAIEILTGLRREEPEDAGLLSAEIAERIAIAAYAGSRGKIEEAQRRFEAARAPVDELIRLAPAVQEHRIRKAHILSNITVCLHRKNELDAAKGVIREAIAVQERLVEESPDNPDLKGNLAISFKRLAYILGGLKRDEESESAFARAASLWRSALECDPANRDYRYQSGLMLNLLGIVQKDSSKLDAAEKTLREAVRILGALTAEHPAAAAYHGDLGGALCNLGSVLELHEDREQALGCYEEAIASERQALERTPEHATYRGYLITQHICLCKLLLLQQRHRDAAARAEDLAALPFGGHTPRSKAALYHSYCSGLALRDQELPAEEREALRTRYADRAMELLHQAREEGFQRVRSLEDRAFNPIRKRADFQSLLKELGSEVKK